jgi:hypothetical protein
MPSRSGFQAACAALDRRRRKRNTTGAPTPLRVKTQGPKLQQGFLHTPPQHSPPRCDEPQRNTTRRSQAAVIRAHVPLDKHWGGTPLTPSHLNSSTHPQSSPRPGVPQHHLTPSPDKSSIAPLRVRSRGSGRGAKLKPGKIRDLA